MKHIERFFATVDRQPVDRPCIWLGLPDPASFDTLFSYFGVGSMDELIVQLDDDIYPSGYEAHAVLYHEMGHVVNTGVDDNEANADAYAHSRGYEIVDAYSGQH